MLCARRVGGESVCFELRRIKRPSSRERFLREHMSFFKEARLLLLLLSLLLLLLLLRPH